MTEKKQETIVVRTDTGSASSDDKSGTVVAYSKNDNLLIIKYPAYRTRSIRYVAEYAVYKILDREDAAVVAVFKVQKCFGFGTNEPKEGYNIEF